MTKKIRISKEDWELIKAGGNVIVHGIGEITWAANPGSLIIRTAKEIGWYKGPVPNLGKSWVEFQEVRRRRNEK